MANVKISQLPANQSISPASGTINIDGAVIGDINPQTGTFTNVDALTLDGAIGSHTPNTAVVTTLTADAITSNNSITSDGTFSIRTTNATSVNIGIGDIINFQNSTVSLANATTGIPASAIAINNVTAPGTAIFDFFNSSAASGGSSIVNGTNIYLPAGGGKGVPYKVTQPGYLDQYLGFSRGGTNTYFNPLPGKIVSQSLLLSSTPDGLYTTLFNGSYTGSMTNVTGVTDLGTNGINGTKSGSSNITIDVLSNGVLGFDYTATNIHLEFDLGTPNISSFISSNAFTVMAVFKPTNNANLNHSIFEWLNTPEEFALYYNPSTNLIGANTTHTVTTTTISGTAPVALFNTPTLVTWTRDSSNNAKLFANSVQIAATSQASTPTGSAATAIICGATNFANLSGYLAVLSFWKRNLSDTERLPIEQQLRTTFGIV